METDASGGILIYSVFESSAGVAVGLIEHDGNSSGFLGAAQFSNGPSPGLLINAQFNQGALLTLLDEIALNGTTFGLTV
jgi:hypothetical protein